MLAERIPGGEAVPGDVVPSPWAPQCTLAKRSGGGVSSAWPSNQNNRLDLEPLAHKRPQFVGRPGWSAGLFFFFFLFPFFFLPPRPFQAL